MKVAKNPGAAGTRKAKPSFPEALAVLVPLSFTQHMLNRYNSKCSCATADWMS